MNARALVVVVAVALALPARAQEVDELDVKRPISDVPCAAQSGDVILRPDVAIDRAKRLAAAEAKVAVYEAHPPLPVWAVVLLVAAGAVAGVAGTVAVYEVAKRP